MSSTETVLVSEIIPATRERIYAAWLDSDQHSAFTGESADIDPTVGGHHTTFGGYARGRNLELSPNRRIVQTWRSAEFPDTAPDSRIEVTFEDTAGGTLVSVLHTDIPSGQADRYREGWLRFYLEPMKRYFRSRFPHVTNGKHHPSRYDDHDDLRVVYDSGHTPAPYEIPHVRLAVQSGLASRNKKKATRPSPTLTRKAQMKTKKSTKSAAKSKGKAKGKAKKKKAAKKTAKKKAKKKAARRR